MSRIGIISYTYAAGRMALREIIYNDVSKCIGRNQDSATMEDGTKYFLLNSEMALRGSNLDQIIIADDIRWNVYSKKRELIHEAKKCLRNQYIPEEFLVLNYEC